MPLLLIGMMRPVPQRDDLLALRRAVGDAARLQLTGLPPAAVTELVAALVNGWPAKPTSCCGSLTAPRAIRSTSPNWSPRWLAAPA